VAALQHSGGVVQSRWPRVNFSFARNQKLRRGAIAAAAPLRCSFEHNQPKMAHCKMQADHNSLFLCKT